MEDEMLRVTWNTHQPAMISVFKSMYDSKTLVDCTLAAEGKSLKAHKVVISACSPYLKDLLSDHETESHPIIILNNTRFCDLENIMEYVYNGCVNVLHKNMASFLKTAEVLKIRGLANCGIDAGTSPVSHAKRKRRRCSTSLTGDDDKSGVLGSSENIAEKVLVESMCVETNSTTNESNEDELMVPKEELIEELSNQTEAEQETSDRQDILLVDDPSGSNELGYPEQWGEPEDEDVEVCEEIDVEEDVKDVKLTTLPDGYSWFLLKSGPTADQSEESEKSLSPVAEEKETRVFKCSICEASFFEMEDFESHKSKHKSRAPAPGRNDESEVTVVTLGTMDERRVAVFPPGTKFQTEVAVTPKGTALEIAGAVSTPGTKFEIAGAVPTPGTKFERGAVSTPVTKFERGAVSTSDTKFENVKIKEGVVTSVAATEAPQEMTSLMKAHPEHLRLARAVVQNLFTPGISLGAVVPGPDVKKEPGGELLPGHGKPSPSAKSASPGFWCSQCCRVFSSHDSTVKSVCANSSSGYHEFVVVLRQELNTCVLCQRHFLTKEEFSKHQKTCEIT